MAKELNYKEKLNEIIGLLEKEKEIVISTVNGNKVAARTVYFVFYNYCIYFVTSKSYEKYKQIEKNSNVALCFFNISMEGVAIIKGHPELEENKKVFDYCLSKCPEMKKYGKYKNTVFIEIKINKIEMWKGGREYININEKTAYRIG